MIGGLLAQTRLKFQADMTCTLGALTRHGWAVEQLEFSATRGLFLLRREGARRVLVARFNEHRDPRVMFAIFDESIRGVNHAEIEEALRNEAPREPLANEVRPPNPPGDVRPGGGP